MSRRHVDPARRAAWETILAVDTRDAYANLALPALLHRRRLPARDAALATELTYGTLRGLGTYDAILACCVDRPLPEVGDSVRAVLRMGAHQILSMRVPPHAAVSTSVDLASVVAGPGAGRFVNAVLRRVSEHDFAAWVDRIAADQAHGVAGASRAGGRGGPSAQVAAGGHPDDAGEPDARLGLRTLHPPWVVAAFREALDAQGRAAELPDLLAADNLPPAVTLVARPGSATVAELLDHGALPGRWSPYGAVLGRGDPAAVPAVAQGRAGVQDEGSQLVALALAAVPVVGPDRRWADVAAGPGGKAALLAGLGGERGVALTAAERHEHRARLVAAALPAGAGAVVVADSRRPPWRDGTFDRVLLDAPCTGLGALRRRPEARWRRDPGDLPGLAGVQRDLLRAAVRSTRPGGVVAYATCSPHLAETRDVVEAVLAEGAGAEPLDAAAVLREVTDGRMGDAGAGPWAQLWPHRHGTDAMFLALLRRTADGPAAAPH